MDIYISKLLLKSLFA